jgi:cation transport ATPase
MKSRLDWIGIGTSAICSVHCVLLPLFVSSLPIAGINLLENFWIEAALICVAMIVGGLSFYKGCFKKHKNKKPLIVFLIGFAFLLINQVEENSLLILSASLFIILAHAWNYRLLRKYNCSRRVI